ncbi:unnamed protein product (macronuclear) [Paramecium tetraurelia]|uniref:Uncharacterized protein n=1 Tax=Paramecium tetraurelia TaxID=5888 RepID=A0D5Z3_PARTE|nr:uncharacterized protein GSPATT00013890001 [Paramecium tetraurelia]CAK78460.1 unnamed protein product [Paramecium tetraurelia]|eukprot:XP_001445857.1 hypothetical protein (macronuclear) [Paramecium tetraurelia strain d4-2]
MNQSLPHQIRIPTLEQDNPYSQEQSDKNIKSYLQPLRNAVAKITEQRQEQQYRRKSTYGQLFGEMTKKEMGNLPTLVEQHKQFNKKELALTSFALMLERKQRKKTTRKLSKRLSKQESIIEFDNMERPPSCITPPKIVQTPKPQLKSKNKLKKEIYLKDQDFKFGHFLTGRLQQSKKLQPELNHKIRYHCQTQSCASLPNGQLSSFASSPKVLTTIKSNTLAIIQDFKLTSRKQVVRPYTKHNTLLLKQIQQTFEMKPQNRTNKHSIKYTKIMSESNQYIY